jgi:hypothetical protein
MINDLKFKGSCNQKQKKIIGDLSYQKKKISELKFLNAELEKQEYR